MNPTRPDAVEKMDTRDLPSPVMKRVRQDTKSSQVPSTSSTKVQNTVMSKKPGWSSTKNFVESNKSVRVWLVAVKSASTPNKSTHEEAKTSVNSPS